MSIKKSLQQTYCLIYFPANAEASDFFYTYRECPWALCRKLSGLIIGEGSDQGRNVVAQYNAADRQTRNTGPRTWCKFSDTQTGLGARHAKEKIKPCILWAIQLRRNMLRKQPGILSGIGQSPIAFCTSPGKLRFFFILTSIKTRIAMQFKPTPTTEASVANKVFLKGSDLAKFTQTELAAILENCSVLKIKNYSNHKRLTTTAWCSSTPTRKLVNSTIFMHHYHRRCTVDCLQ